MAEKVPITGTIARINGVTPGPSSGISYLINVNFPGGVAPLDFQIPSVRYGDAVSIDAGALLGRLVQGTLDGQFLWWHFMELIAFGLCPGVSPPPNPLTVRIDPHTGMPPVVPPDTGGSGANPLASPATKDQS